MKRYQLIHLYGQDIRKLVDGTYTPPDGASVVAFQAYGFFIELLLEFESNEKDGGNDDRR
jgi:hypothetical protein